MKIQYASDLHLEFPEQRSAINSKRLKPVGDILVLAGDVCYLREDHFKFGFFDYCSDNWKQTYIIPGNHEFYNHSYDIADAVSEFLIQVRNNVQYLNNTSIEIQNVRIIFSTLWTNISGNPFEIEIAMNDFHVCSYNGQVFCAKDHNICNSKSMDFLNSILNIKSECSKTIIVSHHIPFSGDLCKYPFDSSLEEGFHIDLSMMIANHDIDYWIYGHNHHNLPPFEIEGTMLLTNQMGYVQMQENRTFDRKALIEV